MSHTDIQQWLDRLLKGERLALSRIISKIENGDPELDKIVSTLYSHTGKARILGLTGAPGSGKSTLVDQFIFKLRAENKKVAVIAVDPSSPFSGGAILGDRIRMQKHIGDEGVYIRSLGTRGQQGGLSRYTRNVVYALDAFGFDSIIIETAGVGQTELSILQIAQTIGVVLVPEGGDGIQMMKAGLMEIADVFIINKSDRPEADQIKKAITLMLSISPQLKSDWAPPIVQTIASQAKGVEEVLQKFNEHKIFREQNKKNELELQLLKDEIKEVIISELEMKIDDFFNSEKGKKTIQALKLKKLDPFQAAKQFLNKN